MAHAIENKIRELGLALPEPPVSVASYEPYSITGKLVFISGQLPIINGQAKFKGKVGKPLTIEEGALAAKLCTLNMLAHLQNACRTIYPKQGLNSVTKVVKIEGYVNSMPGFEDQPKIINGASDLIVSIFGKKIGSHSRIAVGVTSLPLDMPVEISGIFEIE
ncbi:MAG: RidA family protein [Alphaproteobacteria bacterium]